MWEYNDLRLLQEKDLYLVPFCFLLLFAIAYGVRRKYKGTFREKYFFPALFLRFFFVIVYTLVIAFYYGFGDTSFYFQAVTDLRNALGNDSSLWQDIFLNLKLDVASPLYSHFMYDNGLATHLYMLNVSNYMVPRFALPFSMLFSNSYLCMSFCLSFYSFAGCWRIFKMFTEMYPHLHKKIAIATLFLPSVLFWGGSLLKDSICMGSLGLALYALYSITIKRRKVMVSLVILFITGFLLFYIKPYILLCLVPTFLLWMFLRFRKQIKDRVLRNISGFFFGAISLVAGFFILQTLTETEVASQYSSQKILQTVQGVQGSFSESDGSGSNFTVGTASNSAGQMILLFPLGVFATFFRPFFWEAGNPLMILSALEAFGFLYLVFIGFKRIGIKRFFLLAFDDLPIVFCFAYSILFAGIIGVTTANFGALVRYKIPCIPFFLIMLFVVMDKSGKFSPGVVFGKKLF